MKPSVLAAIFAAGLLPAAHAGPVSDPQGDWYSTVAATQRADLDVKSADGTYIDGVGWLVTASMWGNIDPAQQGSYVWGFGRGAAAAVNPFPGEPNVKFDSVLNVNPHDGTASLRLLDTSVTTALQASNVSISGDTLSAFIPEDLLPTVTGGFSDDAFTWNLWPRLPGGPSTNISDFAPDNAMEPFTTVPASAVPEPGSILLMLAGLPVLAIARRGRQLA